LSVSKSSTASLNVIRPFSAAVVKIPRVPTTFRPLAAAIKVRWKIAFAPLLLGGAGGGGAAAAKRKAN
jgi:hypothetical protein